MENMYEGKTEYPMHSVYLKSIKTVSNYLSLITLVERYVTHGLSEHSVALEAAVQHLLLADELS